MSAGSLDPGFVWDLWQRVRTSSPLVQCITNYVSMEVGIHMEAYLHASRQGTIGSTRLRTQIKACWSVNPVKHFIQPT